MSHLVKQWGKGQFGLWTTISDGYLHEPKKLSKEELMDFIEEMWREDLEEKIQEMRKEFPNGWLDKDTHRIINGII